MNSDASYEIRRIHVQMLFERLLESADRSARQVRHIGDKKLAAKVLGI